MANTRQPTSEELKVAIERHVQRSEEAVKRIPMHLRTILSKREAEEWARLREQGND